MSENCGTCSRVQIDLRSKESYLRKVVRSALAHPDWPSNVAKVAAAKEKVAEQKAQFEFHRNTEHKEQGQ